MISFIKQYFFKYLIFLLGKHFFYVIRLKKLNDLRVQWRTKFHHIINSNLGIIKPLQKLLREERQKRKTQSGIIYISFVRLTHSFGDSSPVFGWRAWIELLNLVLVRAALWSSTKHISKLKVNNIDLNTLCWTDYWSKVARALISVRHLRCGWIARKRASFDAQRLFPFRYENMNFESN